MCLHVRMLTPMPDSMVLITDKFWGPSGAESVIGSVHMWLAEAINALQDNRDSLTAKVRLEVLVGMEGLPQHHPGWLKGPCCPPGSLWYLPRSSRAAGTPKSTPRAQAKMKSQTGASWCCRRSPPQVPWRHW